MEPAHRTYRKYVLGIALAAATLAVFLGVGAPIHAAGQDIPTAVEAAFSRVGVTLTDSHTIEDPSYGFASNEWQVEGSANGNEVVVMVEEYSSATQARAVFDSWCENFEGFSDPVNGSPGWSRVNETISNNAEWAAGAEPIWVSTGWTTFLNDVYVIDVTYRPSSDTSFSHRVAAAVDSALDGVGTGGGTGTQEDIEEPPAEEGLSASASPSTFTEVGDTARVSVRLSGSDVAGAAVQLAGHGQDQQAVTDSLGTAEFTVTHDDEAATEYRFVVTAAGHQQSVVIPVLALRVAPEVNPATGEPFAGVAADGASSLVIEIDLGAGTGELAVQTPELGQLGGDALSDSGAVALSGGTAVLSYTAPSYIDGALLTERIVPPEASGATLGSARAAKTVYANQGSPWAAKVPLAFEYTSPDGVVTPVVVDVLVTRAPVMLVHGFTGDASTWAKLQVQLARDKFDPVINEYYEGNQGIHAQAEALGGDIAREIDRYGGLGVRVSRVDVVGHSMGGLITREYTYGLPPHPTDVRKLIMVGTPNHGATFVDKLIGDAASTVGGVHQLANQQLYQKSAFLKNLNEGEAVGRHLSPDIQYGNIYGVPHDAVVTQGSAHLNGVRYRRIENVIHSPALASNAALAVDSLVDIGTLSGWSITESPQVFAWVEDWLGRDIDRIPLVNTRATIVAAEGEVFASGWSLEEGETRTDVTTVPRTLEVYEQVGTGPDGRARLRLSVNGMAWGSIDLAPDTLIALGNLTPDSVSVRVRRGSARFTSLKREGGGHFTVIVGEGEPGEWTTFNPDAKVIGLDTDFVVSTDGEGAVETLVISGEALLDDGTFSTSGEAATLGENQAGAVGVPQSYASELAGDQWWTEGFYRPSVSEVLSEWWAILRSYVDSLLDGTDGPEPPVANGVPQ